MYRDQWLISGKFRLWSINLLHHTGIKDYGYGERGAIFHQCYLCERFPPIKPPFLKYGIFSPQFFGRRTRTPRKAFDNKKLSQITSSLMPPSSKIPAVPDQITLKKCSVLCPAPLTTAWRPGWCHRSYHERKFLVGWPSLLAANWVRNVWEIWWINKKGPDSAGQNCREKWAVLQ